MKIACIGWGSLIWRPEGLAIQNTWFNDGPILPIEFTRVSDNRRVTLIIDSEGTETRCLWALMTFSELNKCIESLKTREGTSISSISSVTTNENTSDPIKSRIKSWLDTHELDAAVWTSLSINKRYSTSRPSIDEILKHLRGLTGPERRMAEEYVRKAPKQIDTAYRRRIEAEFSWTPLNSDGTTA